ncbi:topless-related protein 3-like protein [Corchorus olitorius]|uniref:Topless-related protein 3-like protein n=1 Tax=Corchorus olitorius TaxID=93759 RepID=A0A1R3HQ90_9ROSI|nr:topless-related protein 3-like protein [Corchorus olitorius]
MIEYGSPDHDHLMNHLRSAQSADEVTDPAPPQQASWSLDDQGSTVTSMDFHPSHQTYWYNQ